MTADPSTGNALPDGWEAVIGLEVHARLLTRTKMFCACPLSFGEKPNTQVCPVCLGYPGALPVVNRRAVELALRVALAAGAEVHRRSAFARKNYFYPDLPKGYQVSQSDRPLATGGAVEGVGLVRIHLEEDAGKLLHAAVDSLVDLNRAGTPLIEIVSRPEIATPEQAVRYLTRLRQVLMYTGACDGNMEEGSLRCDANVSVRRAGAPLGTRAEIKNLNSFRFVGRAIEFEVRRQAALLEQGGRVIQETRLYDAAAGETRSMRSKEEAHDYRYFGEPDLHLLAVGDDLLEEARAALPELPAGRAVRYARDFGLSARDAEVLVASRETADYFERTAAASQNPRAAANWVRNEVLAALNERRIELAQFPVTPEALAELIRMIEAGTLGGRAAKEVFEEMASGGGDAAAIVERRGLAQIDDDDALRESARRVLEEHPAQVAQYRAGSTKIFGFLVGQLMKATGGRANAARANEILRELLGS